MSVKTELGTKTKFELMHKVPGGRSLLVWRGHGGGVPTLSSVEYDRQLDKISLWLENWDHDTRCQILEALLVRSSYSQLQFIWTVIQPAMHRDFMYTAKKAFPRQPFIPISTSASREIKKKLEHSRHNNYHRVQSAHLQYYHQVKEVTSEVRERSLDTSSTEQKGSPNPSDSSRSNSRVSWETKGDNFVRLPSITNGKVTSSSLPVSRQRTTSSQRQCTSNCLFRYSSLNSLHDNSSQVEAVNAAVFDGESKSCDCFKKNTPASLRFVKMPVRRHIQHEKTSLSLNRGASSLQTPRSHAKTESGLNDTISQKLTGTLLNQSGLQQLNFQVPLEGSKLIYWYTNLWDNLKRNEFLHKMLLKLDPRQHYFISSFLSLRQYRDFIALLPEHLALKILSYLSHKELINASRVSGTWSSLCNHNDLWRKKCIATRLDIQANGETPEWKQIFKENMFVKKNWSQGRCKIIDCKGHSDRVLSVIFDKKRMATGSLDKTIKIWNLADGRCVQTLKGHNKGIWCLCFFTKNLLISGSYDATIRIWNLKEGNLKRTLLGHEGPVWAIVRRGNTLVSGSQDKTAKVWDISRCRLVHTLRGHSGAVFAVDMDDNGKLVVTASADRSVRIWDCETAKQTKVIWFGHNTSVMTVSYSKGWLACSYGNNINVYKDDGSELVRTYSEHEKRVESIELKITKPEVPEGTLVSGGQDGVIKYWDITREKSVQTLTGHSERINCIHFDETRIVSAAYDNKIKIWDFNV